MRGGEDEFGHRNNGGPLRPLRRRESGPFPKTRFVRVLRNGGRLRELRIAFQIVSTRVGSRAKRIVVLVELARPLPRHCVLEIGQLA